MAHDEGGLGGSAKGSLLWVSEHHLAVRPVSQIGARYGGNGVMAAFGDRGRGVNPRLNPIRPETRQIVASSANGTAGGVTLS